MNSSSSPETHVSLDAVSLKMAHQFTIDVTPGRGRPSLRPSMPKSTQASLTAAQYAILPCESVLFVSMLAKNLP